MIEDEYGIPGDDSVIETIDFADDFHSFHKQRFAPKAVTRWHRESEEPVILGLSAEIKDRMRHLGIKRGE